MSRSVGIPRVGVGFEDRDPRRARLHRVIIDRLNDSAGVTVEVSAPASANQEFAVRHPALRHPAREFEIVMQDKPGRLYRSNASQWTKQVSYFKYSEAGGRLSIRLR